MPAPQVVPVAPQQVFCSTADVWELGLPQKTLFGDENMWRPGVVAEAIRVAGTGTGVADASGNAHDFLAVRVRCVSAGEVNRAGVVNPGPLPRFVLSRDDGATWGRALTVSRDCETAFIDDVDAGIRWSFGGSLPAFLVGDEWRTTAEPSPTMLRDIEHVSSIIATRFLGPTFDQALTSQPAALRWVTAWLVREVGVQRAGFDKDPALAYTKRESPMPQLMGQSAKEWLEDARGGYLVRDRQTGFGGAGDSTLFPDYLAPSEPFGNIGWKI